MKGGYVDIMTNKLQGRLYVGVTNDLARRAFEHREGLIGGFTKPYALKRLAFCWHGLSPEPLGGVIG